MKNGESLYVRVFASLNEYKITYTSPSGVYLDPEMSYRSRATESPSTFSTMNI